MSLFRPSPDRKSAFCGLKGKMLIYFGGLFIATMVVVQLTELFGIPNTVFVGAYKDKHDDALRELGFLADTKKDLLLNWLTERRSDVRQLSNEDSVEHAVTQLTRELANEGAIARGPQAYWIEHRARPAFHTLFKHLEGLQETRAAYHAIHIVDARSRLIIASSQNRDVGQNLSNNLLVDGAISPGYNELVDTFKNPIDEKHYIAITRQLHERRPDGTRGGVVAILMALVNPDVTVEQLLNSGQRYLGQTGEAILLNQDLQILTPLHYPLSDGTQAKVMGFQDRSRAAIAASSGQEGATEGRDYRGENVLAVYRYLQISPEFGWALIVKKDMAEVVAPIQTSMRSYVIVALICLALALGFVFLASSRLSRPLRNLSDTARRVEGGDTSARAAVISCDEVGDLAQTFNAMVDKMSAWQHELEVQVDNRTQQLNRSNRLYATLSATNQAIVHAADRDELFKEACKIAVEVGGLKVAWIGLLDEDNAPLRPYCGFTRETGPFGAIEKTNSEFTIYCSPPAVCVHEKRVVVSNDLSVDETSPDWKKNVSPCNCFAVVSLPIMLNSEQIGVFTLCSEEKCCFDDRELALIEEMASDISFAISNINKERLRYEAEDKVRHNEERVSLLLDSTAEGIYGVGLDGLCTFVNPSCVHFLGYDDPSELLGKHIHELTHHTRVDGSPYPAEECKIFSSFKGGTEGSGAIDDEVFWRKDGTSFPVEYRAHSIVHNGEVVGAVCAFHDISSRKLAQDAMRRSKEFTDHLIDTANVMIVGLDGEGRIVIFNEAAEKVSGYDHQELENKNWFEILVPYERYPHMWHVFSDALAGHEFPAVFESAVQTRFGEARVISWRGSLVQDMDSPAAMVLFGIDVTDQKIAEDKLRHNAFYDPLSNLPNRSLLLDRLDQALKRMQRNASEQFAVLFLDLDRFKNINDSLGHLAGDQLLVKVSEILKECVRPGDTVSRIGGDEFAILAENIGDISEAISIAERINEDLTLPFQLSGREVFISASIGIAKGSVDYLQPVDLLRDADTAMYHAKGEGKARYQLFDPRMHSNVMARLTIETEIRHALERGEFQVYYQPIVSLKLKRVAGFEALIRWQHPLHGLVSPHEFIPIAEETGLINAIGRFVLFEATRQIGEWQRLHQASPPLYVSVNLSALQFQQPDLLEQVERALVKADIPAESLRLEVTETVLMENMDIATGVLLKMVERGVRLYLDDFGTGYSSLSYLQQLPFDSLKIDKSFVAALGREPEKTGLVPTIIALAHNFGMGVIAEGVENEHQLAHLAALNCEYIQGFYFSRPQPASDAEKLIDGLEVI